jgi:hypothetical protein
MLVSNDPCLVRALHRSFASKKARPNSLRSLGQSEAFPRHNNEKKHTLSPDVAEVERRCDADDEIGLLLLVQAGDHERQALPLPATIRGSSRRGHAVAEGFHEPECQSGEHAWVREQVQVRPLGEHDDSVPAHRADILFIDDRGALPDDRPMKRHGEGECVPQSGNAEAHVQILRKAK